MLSPAGAAAASIGLTRADEIHKILTLSLLAGFHWSRTKTLQLSSGVACSCFSKVLAGASKEAVWANASEEAFETRSAAEP